MSNFPFIIIDSISIEGIEMGQMKGQNMFNETTTEKQKPIVSIGNIDIEIDLNKPSERYIITKKYQGTKLFYKKRRRACTSYLSKGTHFDTLKEAQDHFDTFIKSNWKHTKKFQIEPVSNFFISDWRLVTDYNSYGGNHELAEKKKVILKNVPISIDDYKRGKKLTTVKELLDKFVTEASKQKGYEERQIIDIENRIIAYKNDIEKTKFKIQDRNEKLATLLQHDSTIADLIEQNTTEAERTVKLFYGVE